MPQEERDSEQQVERAMKACEQFVAFIDGLSGPCTDERLMDLEERLDALASGCSGLRHAEAVLGDESDPELPSRSVVRKKISFRFKELGYYHNVLNMLDVCEDPDPSIGDAIDDLLDIYLDSRDAMFAAKKFGPRAGARQLRFAFEGHIREHLRGVLRALSKELQRRRLKGYDATRD